MYITKNALLINCFCLLRGLWAHSFSQKEQNMKMYISIIGK